MRQTEVVEICLLAGKIMLQSGAETYRVEDTMIRIAQAFAIENAQVHATPTAIMFGYDITAPTHFVRIEERATDLHKVSQVNSISRHVSSQQLSIEEADKQLRQVDQQRDTYPNWVQLLAAAFASGGFTIMFDGRWSDFIPAVIVGGIGYGMMRYLHNVIKIRFFAEFLASILLGVSAFFVVQIGWGLEIDNIIIGSVMPLVPGLLITNAVRDLMAGHLVSGITKGAEAFLTAFAIGAGVSIIFFLVR
ncbi:threonine/serine exporter family protein [Amphibacillus jilinensis]|uniref:threonine/serine exporter family protein n=1 Tax=Amphibacillus jilinensis TaxID=1216008 RepID=UPI000302E2B9|nr:threonine/serine exporter family protein [Amphibacillus jilinensis]